MTECEVMKVLVGNDDGIKSESMLTLAKLLSKKHSVTVVAPKNNMSACSHSLTIGKPVSVSCEKELESDSLKIYSVGGTPADCVKVAYHVLEDFSADICVSGINKGHNLGSDTMYSGTLSVAIEAAYFGCISFAFSAFSHADFDMVGFSEIAEKIIDCLIPFSKKGDVWNINFPNLAASEIKGIKVTPFGIHKYCDYYEKQSDGNYILKGYPLFDPNDKSDCDIYWVNSGYISVTPVLFNRTDYFLADKVREKCETLL